MRNRVFVFTAIVMFAFLTAAGAIDLNSQWKGDTKTPNGDNLEINFNFHVGGEKLTGTVANTHGEEQIAEGTGIRFRSSSSPAAGSSGLRTRAPSPERI